MDRKRERLLIQAAKRGDSQAFSEIYNAYVDRIYHYVYARVSVKHVAEDLTGDVFVRVLEGLSGYEDRNTPILAWMYRIAHARVVDYYRLSRKSENHEDIDAIQVRVDDNVDESLISAYETQTVQEAILELSPDQQQVIMLRFVEGHNLEETAALLGKKVQAIKSLQYRAVQTLSKLLQTLQQPIDEE